MDNDTPSIDELKQALKHAKKSKHKHMVKAIKMQIEVQEQLIVKPKNILSRIFGNRKQKKVANG